MTSPSYHDDPALLAQRKIDHLELCRDQDVEARNRTTLLEEVRLIHDSLPELDVAAIDTSVTLLGKRLSAPLMISGMTGGAPQAASVNRVLAGVAERLGLGFGVGSQRPMLRDPATRATYAVRDVAPTTLVLGNIGGVQAAASTTAQIRDLLEAIGADALCVHLNPAQEIVQAHGDRSFVGVLDAIERLVNELDLPVVAKETGCGMSRRTLERLKRAGVAAVDVSGAGGTTWVGVETLRATAARRALGESLWDWGIPTAASVAWAAELGLVVIASGGVRDGVDAARAVALGATAASSALPWLRAAMSGNEADAVALGERLIEEFRAVMLLTGSGSVDALVRAPRVLGPELERWVAGG